MVSPVIPLRPTGPTDRQNAGPPAASVTPLTESAARNHMTGVCFKIGPPRLVGVELEWFVHDDRCPDEPVPPERLHAALDALPIGGPDGTSLPSGARLTLEPGGQVELSSPPADSLTGCVADTRRDLAALRSAFAAQGLRLTGTGTDPLARPRRMVLDHPRYRAMEHHFDSAGPWGRIMMTGTASLQVCLDAGAESGPQALDRRWRLAHRLGPVLVAAFANSPLLDGRPTGHRSTRQTVWSRMDPSRTLAPAPDHGDPREAWTRYVLDARGALRAPPRRPAVDRAHRTDLPRLAARRRRAAAHPGRPRLPPHHAVPAGPPARPPGAADDRRPARGRLDRPRRAGHRAAGRPGRRGHRARRPGAAGAAAGHRRSARAAQRRLAPGRRPGDGRPRAAPRRPHLLRRRRRRAGPTARRRAAARHRRRVRRALSRARPLPGRRPAGRPALRHPTHSPEEAAP